MTLRAAALLVDVWRRGISVQMKRQEKNKEKEERADETARG
jgi:hypothetical protein